MTHTKTVIIRIIARRLHHLQGQALRRNTQINLDSHTRGPVKVVIGAWNRRKCMVYGKKAISNKYFFSILRKCLQFRKI